MCRAARSGDPQAVALLLEGGVDARSVDDDGQPAIQLAVLAGDGEGCRALLAGGADPWALNYAGQTALDSVADVTDGAAREELAHVLADTSPRAGVDVDSRHADGATALHLAAFDGNAPLVDELLARGADLSLRDSVFDGTPAGWANAGGHTELATGSPSGQDHGHRRNAWTNAGL